MAWPQLLSIVTTNIDPTPCHWVDWPDESPNEFMPICWFTTNIHLLIHDLLRRHLVSSNFLLLSFLWSSFFRYPHGQRLCFQELLTRQRSLSYMLGNSIDKKRPAESYSLMRPVKWRVIWIEVLYKEIWWELHVNRSCRAPETAGTVADDHGKRQLVWKWSSHEDNKRKGITPALRCCYRACHNGER
jgi:hypothetical protein